ncbi:MAG TPA: hypothetical protein VFK78_07100 [Gemmatimonadales bacterium]|nr:hypothetical protein [Gemmatimonadales bacterium]
MLRKLMSPAALALLWAAACSGDNGATPLPACTPAAGGAVALAAGQYTAIDPAADHGCAVFPANASATDTVEYLVVAQSASGVPGTTSPFILNAGGSLTVAGSPARPARSAAQRFHDHLREIEETGDYASILPAGFRPRPAPPVVAGAPPDSGTLRTFKVCANLNCNPLKNVTARALIVRPPLALYVDTLAPSSGLTAGDLDSLATVFTTRLFAIDTTRFGRESDIDQNSVVIVLMTPQVNALVTSSQCHTGGFVAGYFFGADIDPTFAGSFNDGEIFYSIVADPDSVYSCPHPATEVKHLVPVTFIHEFQHMISYNQHVLVRHGQSEVLWLNEGMSHFAEELGGRSYLAEGDSTSFERFIVGDFYNASQFFDSTEHHFLLPGSGISTLAERGGAWAFVRYLVGRYGDSLTNKLEQTSATGAANVQLQTGAPFAQSVTRWALANWVSDLPGFTPPPELTYASSQLRATYAWLHTIVPSAFPPGFPLAPPVGLPSSVTLADTLHAGSGSYQRIVQPPGSPTFTLQFGVTPKVAFASNVVARLDVIRIR